MTFSRILGATYLLLSLAMGPAWAGETVTVFAAASMKTALDDVAEAYARTSTDEVTVSYAASSALARQIEAGAPADLFISADLQWMDYLAGRGLIDPASRLELLGNELVVVAPSTSPLTSLALDAASFAAAVGDGRWTTGLVQSVPVGIYAKEALVALGLWEQARPSLAEAENVRAALAFVARGEARLGIVYATDASAERRVKVVARIPASSHRPIVYPFALTRSAQGQAAARFLAFMAGKEGQAIFTAKGFAILER